MCYISSVITVRAVETSVSVPESSGSVDLCLNVTHGEVESSAFIRYTTISGSAIGMFNFILLINAWYVCYLLTCTLQLRFTDVKTVV